MENQKVYFYRDESPSSQEAKEILDSHHVRYEEVFSQSDGELPRIISPKSAVSFAGSEGVNLFVSFFAEGM